MLDTNSYLNDLSKLAYRFNLDDDSVLPSPLFERALSKALILLGERPTQLVNDSRSLSSFRDFLDRNSIVYRQVVTPDHIIDYDHPMLIVCSDDSSDIYCSPSSLKSKQVYSANQNKFIDSSNMLELSSTSFEIYASLPDESVSILELFSYTFLNQGWSVVRLLFVAFFGTLLYVSMLEGW